MEQNENLMNSDPRCHDIFGNIQQLTGCRNHHHHSDQNLLKSQQCLFWLLLIVINPSGEVALKLLGYLANFT